MLIAGYLPSSLSDFPGKICSIIFTQGCNFKCPFCHNPELIPAKGTTTVNEDEFFAFLQKRKGKLDGVSITGGEPLIHDDIVEFIKKIKDLGFLVKIDTNGSYPQQLEKILNSGLVDFAAMDVKTSPEKYSQVTGYDIDFNKIIESIKLIKQFPDYEFRVTAVPGLVEKHDINAIANLLSPAKTIAIQQFKNKITYSPQFNQIQPYTSSFLKEMKQILEGKIERILIRE